MTFPQFLPAADWLSSVHTLHAHLGRETLQDVEFCGAFLHVTIGTARLHFVCYFALQIPQHLPLARLWGSHGFAQLGIVRNISPVCCSLLEATGRAIVSSGMHSLTLCLRYLECDALASSADCHAFNHLH